MYLSPLLEPHWMHVISMPAAIGQPLGKQQIGGSGNSRVVFRLNKWTDFFESSHSDTSFSQSVGLRG